MNNIDLIDKYFENSLSPKEQVKFNDLLQNNKAFVKEFAFQKDLRKIISVKQQEELKTTLQQVEAKIQNKSPFLVVPKKWLIAASIALFLSFGLWSVKNTFFPSSETLYAENFEPYRNIVQPIVRGEGINTIEYKAYVSYENGNYYKAINLFNSVKNPNETHVLFYKAMSYLATNKTTEAILVLLPIATSNNLEESDFNFNEKANWYLALAYLKNGDTKKAVSQFSYVANHPENTFKKEEAIDILKYLN
jgi:tetratricopeptide (TPR) repeat protein